MLDKEIELYYNKYTLWLFIMPFSPPSFRTKQRIRLIFYSGTTILCLGFGLRLFLYPSVCIPLWILPTSIGLFLIIAIYFGERKPHR
jgi:hypothetical protein